jgi:hypothetical protein
MPEEHWRAIKTNNPLERVLREIRRALIVRATRLISAPAGSFFIEPNREMSLIIWIPKVVKAAGRSFGQTAIAITRWLFTPKEWGWPEEGTRACHNAKNARCVRSLASEPEQTGPTDC